MGIKKKLGLGAASAALGLSLIGGGTWAAFNDVENMQNSLAAGTLNLGLSASDEEGVLQNFKLSNLKPGDEFSRAFKISNRGSLAIKEVWLDVIPANFQNGVNEFVNKHGMADNGLDGLDFLNQFAVEIIRTGTEGTPTTIVTMNDGVTLKDLALGTLPITDTNILKDGKINLAPINSGDPQWSGLPADPRDYEIVEITISMIDNSSKVPDPSSPAFGEYYQNKYQGDSIDLGFQFEATQWEGRVIPDNQNGFVEENRTSNPGVKNEDVVRKP